MKLTTMQNILIIHAVGEPFYFTFVSLVYFSRFNYIGLLATALIFLGFVMVVDFFMVALVINRSLAMFASPLGTWIPFALFFPVTYFLD